MKFLKLLLLLLSVQAQAESQVELNIYTDRSVEYLAPVEKAYEEKTGVEINVISMGYAELLQRLEVDREDTRADLIFVKDMVYLNELASKGMFQPMTTDAPEAFVASSMRHPEGLWTAVTMRPRTIVYNKDRFPEGEALTYADLSNEKWADKLCLRTSKSSYNVALASSFIESMGYEGAKTMLKGWMSNLHNEGPIKNDRGVLDAIASGKCDVGVVNSYYLAGKLKDDHKYPVGITFADQEAGGVHVNGTGVGVSSFSTQVDEANAFIELMLSDSSQLHFSETHLDYPAKRNLIPDTLVQDWGVFQAEEVNWSVLGTHHEAARNIFEEIGYL